MRNSAPLGPLRGAQSGRRFDIRMMFLKETTIPKAIITNSPQGVVPAK
jgi:hypothetical protein